MLLPSTFRTAAVFAILIVAHVVAASPSTAPSTAPTTQRTAERIMAEIQSAGLEISSNFKSPDTLTDPAKRAEIAPKVMPSLTHMMALADELAGTEQGKAVAPQIRGQVLTVLALLADEQATAKIGAMTASADPDESTAAKCAMLLASWWKNPKDVSVQTKVLDQAADLAKLNPQSAALFQALRGMSEIGFASPELRNRVITIITQHMKGSDDDMAALKLRALENKPLEIAGVRNDSTTFTTADWKGKVILVDFWATWCGPCKEELPRVKKAYADFHEKGLEVLGVSCDNAGADLKKFLAANPDMPWPQLFDEKTPGWHPRAKDYGINGIPTMFLIDKKGVVRTVDARANFEEMIPVLLKE